MASESEAVAEGDVEGTHREDVDETPEGEVEESPEEDIEETSEGDVEEEDVPTEKKRSRVLLRIWAERLEQLERDAQEVVRRAEEDIMLEKWGREIVAILASVDTRIEFFTNLQIVQGLETVDQPQKGKKKSLEERLKIMEQETMKAEVEIDAGERCAQIFTGINSPMLKEFFYEEIVKCNADIENVMNSTGGACAKFTKCLRNILET